MEAEGKGSVAEPWSRLGVAGGGGGGAQLYEAAIRLKEALRGRAALLLVDRTDIVDAAEADGVLLSAQGAYLHALIKSLETYI